MTSDISWFLYVLKCSDGSLYTGITKNIERRLKNHNDGKGAKYTRSRRPCEVLSFFGPLSKSSALKTEIRFKNLSRVKKQQYASLSLKTFLEEMCSDLFPENLNAYQDN